MVLSQEGAGKNCDSLAIAPYITMCIGPQTKPSSDEVAKWSLEQLLDHVEKQALSECVGWMQTQKKVADKYGLKLVCYEAGQHLVGVGGGENNEQLTKLFHAANRHPRIGAIYGKYLDTWRNLGGDCGRERRRKQADNGYHSPRGSRIEKQILAQAVDIAWRVAVSRRDDALAVVGVRQEGVSSGVCVALLEGAHA
jgi:hypothetical protein